MTAAVLLCLLTVSAEDATAVRAKVLDGSGRNEQVGDLELWISQAAAKVGSPLAKPYTGWIALTGESQRLRGQRFRTIRSIGGIRFAAVGLPGMLI